MRFLKYLVIFCAALLLFSGCGGPKTKIVNVWKPQEYKPVPFSKIISVAFTRDETVGRIAEDEFVRQLTGTTKGVTGYSLIPKDLRGKTDKVKVILNDAEVDGVVVFRLADINHDVDYSPGQAYSNFYGYYGYAWSTTYAPAYVDVKRIVSIEASVYRVSDEKLIWSGHSQSTNPESTKKLIDDLARLVVKELQKDGLVK